MTITRLAKLAGVNRSYLAEIEHGARNLRMSTLIQIVHSLDTTVAELLRGLEEIAVKTDGRSKR